MVKSVIEDQLFTIWWRCGENRSGEFWDNLSKRFILKKETTECTSLPILNSGVTGPKFTKFSCNVSRSSKMERLKSEWRYSKQFWNVKAKN